MNRSARESIATEKLMKTSGNTVYAKAAKTAAKLLALASDPKIASKPELIAETISKALKAKQPKARYASGSGAKFLVTFRKLASDAMSDRFIQFMIRQSTRRS